MHGILDTGMIFWENTYIIKYINFSINIYTESISEIVDVLHV